MSTTETNARLPKRFYFGDVADEDDCIAAIQGSRLPSDLSIGTIQLCVIRGIRYHSGFGEELRGLPGRPEFTRALNARSIMDNVVPDMNELDEFPYCIWYPDLPNEKTLKELVRRYPQMCYQAGRTCAVAGYDTLYHQLNLLPDISIAEEALANKQSGKAIYNEIIRQPIRYAVMNDYTRSANPSTAKSGVFLNGDTCVRSMLDIKKDFRSHYRHYFNITEDASIDEYKSGIQAINPETIQLLYSPLPPDLLTVDKDLLILMAAWSGNIDRYTRLRRPQWINGELECVIRGIYHDTMFAKWWSMQLKTDCETRKAINARFIMNNDLSRITESTPEDELPYLIWHPHQADESTYRELVRRKPSMKVQVARACIAANFQTLYDELLPKPSVHLSREADKSPNRHYLQDLERREAEMNMDICDFIGGYDPEEDAYIHTLFREIRGDRTNRLWGSLSIFHMGHLLEGADEDDIGAPKGSIDLFVCAPEALRPPPDAIFRNLFTVYEEGNYPNTIGEVGLYRIKSSFRGRGGARMRGRGRGRD